MKDRRRLLALFLVLGSFSSTSNAEKTCQVPTCHGSSESLYKYEQGTNYKYKGDISYKIKVHGADKEAHDIKGSLDVDVSAITPCNFALKVSNYNVKDHAGKVVDGGPAVNGHAAKFSFNNGQVDSEICTEEEDSETGLNVKRSVISLFQSGLHKESGSGSHVETDIFGVCPTDFEFSKSGNTLKIKKIRNLNECANRESLSVPFFSTPYNIKSELQSSPLLLSNYKLEQDIKDGILSSAYSEENYKYQPHNTVQSGVEVSVTIKLTLQSKSKGAPISANVNVPKTIIFEAPHKAFQGSSSKLIQGALDKAENAVEPTVQQDAAKYFAELVDILAASTKDDISSVYAACQSKNTAKHIFIDGAARASTGPAIEFLAELYQKNELSKLQKGLFVTGLAFTKHVTKGSLKAVLPLLTSGEYQAYLGVGSLAGRYCSQHDCNEDSEFKEVVNKLAEPISSGCKTSNFKDENKVIGSLKALHNVHHLTNEIVDKIAQCAADKNVKTRVRVAALETFQSDASKSKLKTTAIAILKDLEEDSEVRIKAYLALVECPCHKVADAVKEVLDKEEINQVGNFIVSHLRNIRSSTNPDKEAAKHFLSQIHVNKKFPFDRRKFSHNNELSYSLDVLNLGASGESNIIFSEKSYIPRSYSLNLTTQLFGHSFNLFEFNARTENLDYQLESLFGPKGSLKVQSESDLINNFGKYFSKVNKKINEKQKSLIRDKREGDIYIPRHPRDLSHIKFENEIDVDDNDLHLDLSVKLYGSEVGWYAFDSHKQLSSDQVIDKIFQSLDTSYDSLKNIDVDFKKHLNFLDVAAIYPTASGLPLKLASKGSSAVRVKVDGKVDIPALLKDSKNAYLKFQIIPSAAIEVSGQVSIDGLSDELGVKIFGTIHTSTGTDISVRVLEGKGVDVKVGLPIKKQELVSLHSDIVAVVKQNGVSLVETPISIEATRNTYNGCFDQFSSFVGLTFCGKVDFPFDSRTAYLPGIGRSDVAFYVEKEDDSLTTFNFKALYNKDTSVKTLELLFDTPNTKTDRKHKLVISRSVASNQKFITASLDLPYKKVLFDARAITADKEHYLSAKLVEDSNEYSFKIGALESGSDPNHLTFKPIFEYKLPSSDHKGLSAKFTKGSGKHQAVSVGGLIKLDIEPGKRKYTLDEVSLTTNGKTYKVDGTITATSTALDTQLKVLYDQENIGFKFNLEGSYLKEGKYYSGYLETTFSEQPDINFVVDWKLKKEQHKVSHELCIVHGPNPKDEEHKISVKQEYVYKYAGPKSFEYSTKNSVSYPLVALAGNIDGEVTDHSLAYYVKGNYDKYPVSSSLKANTGVAKPGDYNVIFKTQFLENSVDLHLKRDIVSDVKSKFTNSLELKPGGVYQVNALVIHNFKKDNFHNSIVATAKFPADPKEIKLDAGIKHTPKEFETKFEISSSNKKYVEFKVSTSQGHSGEYVGNLPPNFESKGNYKIDKNNVVGELFVFYPKHDRKIEGKAQLNLANSKVVGFAALAWDSSKNPDKKIKIETDSYFSKQKINSKNKFIFKNDQVTKLDFNHALDQQAKESSLNHDVELVLPSGKSYSATNKLKYSVPQSQDKFALVDLKFKHHSSPGQLADEIGFHIKSTESNKGALSSDVSLSYGNGAGKDAKFHGSYSVAKNDDGEAYIISKGSVSVSGSLPPYPVNANFETKLSKEFINCHLNSDNTLPFGSYDVDFTAGEICVKGNGKINKHEISHEVDVKLPKDHAIHAFKLSSSNEVYIYEKVKSNNEIKWNGDKFLKVNLSGAKEQNGGSGKLEWESHLKPLRSISGKAHVSPSNEAGDQKLDAAFDFNYEGKVASFDLDAAYNEKSHLFNAKVNGNLPEQGKFDLAVKHQLLNGGYGLKTDVALNVNEKKISVSNHVVLDKENPLLDLNAEHPLGKSRFFLKITKKAEKHYAGESEIIWANNGGGNINLKGETKFNSIEDFFFKLNADSPKLKIDKYHVEIANKPAKTSGKRITFVAKNAEKTIFGGSTTYNLKEEDGSLDGSGTIKIGEKTYPLTFKFSQATVDSGDDEGKEINLYVKFGKAVYEVYGKASKTAFVIKRTYTKESGQVTNAEISSYLKKNSVAEYDYEFNLILDLSQIFENENDISLKISTKRNGFILDHNFELKRTQESKIHYQLYIHEDKAGAVLTLPKRVIAAESKYNILSKANNKDKATLKAEASLWLDKLKAPKEKSSISLTADLNKVSDNGLSFSGEARAAHPALGKDLVISGKATVLPSSNKLVDIKGEFDVFSKQDQKIVVEFKSTKSKDKDSYNFNNNFHAKGGSLDVESKISVHVSKNHIKYSAVYSYTDAEKHKKDGKFLLEATDNGSEILIRIPGQTIISAKFTKKVHGNSISVDGNYEILGQKHAEHVEIDSYTHVKYVLTLNKGANEKKLSSDFGYKVGEVAEFTVVFDNKEVLYTQIALDDANFLKHKNNYNVANGNHLIDYAKEQYISSVKKLNAVLTESIKKVSNDAIFHLEQTEKNLPKFEAVSKSYSEQISALKEEIVNDKSIQEVADYIKGTLSVVLEQIAIVVEELAKTVTTLTEQIRELAGQLVESLKKITPVVTEAYEKIAKILIDLFDATLQYGADLFKLALDKIAEHEEEIKIVVDAVTEFAYEIGQIGVKVYQQFKEHVIGFIQVTIEQVKALPIFEELKSRYEELKNYEIPPEFYDEFNDYVEIVAGVLPTQELKDFIHDLSTILIKLLKHEQVNTDNLYPQFVSALKSVVVLLKQHLPLTETILQPSLIALPTFNFYKLPTKGGVHFSLIRWLRSNDLPTYKELVYTYWPTSLNPVDYIPPYAGHGYLLSSSQVFTFNQNHVTFNGNCKYLLAEDVIDGNFSIVADVQNGHIKSIIVSDKTDSIEITHDGKINGNGKPQEYPLFQNNLQAWRRYPTANIYSNAGVYVHCSLDLDLCSFKISGFYFGKTRGLLGSLNNEQYTDFTLPNGKITSSQTEFVNAYKVGGCADVAPYTESHHKEEICTDLFTSDSSFFGLCFPSINPHHYRHACNALTKVSSDKKEAACRVAAAYYKACHDKGIIVPYPDTCVQCEINGKTISIDDEEIVKPQSKADFLVIIRQIEENEDTYNNLISPLVSQIKKDLSAKGVNDVKFSLIAFGGAGQKWPQHYTIDGKLDYQGNTKLEFSKNPKVKYEEFHDNASKLKYLYNSLKQNVSYELGQDSQTIMINEAIAYPFRPDAYKGIIGLCGEICHNGALPVSLYKIRFYINSALTSLKGIKYFHFSDVSNFEHKNVEDGAKQANDIVSFDDENAYFLNGETDDISHYTYPFDLCISITKAIDGAVFRTENFNQGSPDAKKKFLHVTSELITNKLTKDKQELTCTCEADDVYPTTSCYVSDTAEKEQLQKFTKKGVKGVKG